MNFKILIIYFYRFIEERSFVSDMDMAGLALFDECTERVEEENSMSFPYYFKTKKNFNFYFYLFIYLFI